MRKAIAIDFDGCLCTDAFPAIGEPNWPVIKRAQAEQRAGAGLILWTCREDQLLLDAIAACEGWGLTFDSINESLPDWIEAFGTQPRKVGASEYWDDKAVQLPADSQAEIRVERDALIEELRGICWCCAHGRKWENAPGWSKMTTCEHLKEIGVLARSGGKAKCPHWEWRGAKGGAIDAVAELHDQG